MNQFLGNQSSRIVLGVMCAIIFAAIIFFNFENFTTWATLNDPFQTQWAVVQLSDGEILYGHLDGVSEATIGLNDVYLLDKFMPTSTFPNSGAVATSTDFAVGDMSTPTPQARFVPVNDTAQLFLDRSAVLYFKFVPPGDPVLPYLR